MPGGIHINVNDANTTIGLPVHSGMLEIESLVTYSKLPFQHNSLRRWHLIQSGVVTRMRSLCMT